MAASHILSALALQAPGEAFGLSDTLWKVFATARNLSLIWIQQNTTGSDTPEEISA